VDAQPTSQDPQDFDFDALLEKARTLTRPVHFHRVDDLVERHDALARQLALAEKVPDDDRGVNEPTPAVLRLQLEALAEEWAKRGTPVTVRERTRAQMSDATRELRRAHEATQRDDRKPGDRKVKKPTKAQEEAAREEQRQANEEHAKDMLFTQMAEALVQPPLTAAQLRTLHESSIVGEQAVDAIWRLVQEVSALPPVPFSPAPSPSPAGQGSAPS